MKHCETGRLRKFWGVVNSSVHVADCNQEGVGDDDHVHGTAGDQKDRRWLLTIRWYEGRKESALHASFSRFWDWQTTWQHVWNLMNRKGLYAQGSLTCTRNGWLNLVLTTCSACQRVWATLLMECTSLKLHYLTNCRMHHPCFDIGRVRGNRCAIFLLKLELQACVWNKKCIRLPNKLCRFLFK